MNVLLRRKDTSLCSILLCILVEKEQGVMIIKISVRFREMEHISLIDSSA